MVYKLLFTNIEKDERSDDEEILDDEVEASDAKKKIN
jgi:hypothetical protein